MEIAVWALAISIISLFVSFGALIVPMIFRPIPGHDEPIDASDGYVDQDAKPRVKAKVKPGGKRAPRVHDDAWAVKKEKEN